MAQGQATAERIERERAFHDERFSAADDEGRDRFYDHVQGAVEALAARTAGLGNGDRVLELGCGANSLGWDLAARGCDVTAVDISPVAVEQIAGAAATAGLDRITFATMNAEALDFEADSFDAVVGTGILHHLDLARAYAEIARVLRPDGRGVFYEPLGHNPLINAFRRRTPEMRSADEHPLLRRDLRLARSFFSEVDCSMHECLALGAAVAPERIGSVVRPVLAGIDRVILQLPGLRWMAWITVIELNGPC